MVREWDFDLKQRMGVKNAIDVCIFIFTLVVFLIFAKINNVSLYDTFLFLAVIIALNATVFLITKQWISKSIKNSLNQQSLSLSELTDEVLENVNSQKKTVELLASNSRNIMDLIGKLDSISDSSINTSKNAEKQINQSITFSQKEHDAISSNADKMSTLRQKIQMVAELILELSEHSQQIGNTISVVDDIAEQTNMLALNAAVEAARAGEHGKGFAVVAGEIRKLADESKQAITKITSLTNSIQYTTNSTVMATEEGSKEIESVVRAINSLSDDSETLLNFIRDILSSLDLLSQNSQRQNEIILKLKQIDEEITNISSSLIESINLNTEKISSLNDLSKDIKNSASEG